MYIFLTWSYLTFMLKHLYTLTGRTSSGALLTFISWLRDHSSWEIVAVVFCSMFWHYTGNGFCTAGRRACRIRSVRVHLSRLGVLLVRHVATSVRRNYGSHGADGRLRCRANCAGYTRFIAAWFLFLDAFLFAAFMLSLRLIYITLRISTTAEHIWHGRTILSQFLELGGIELFSVSAVFLNECHAVSLKRDRQLHFCLLCFCANLGMF